MAEQGTTPVTLCWADGVTETVQAEPVDDWFAIHDYVRPGHEHLADTPWQTVHIATGLALPRRYRTRAGAAAYATGVSDLANWSGTDRAALAATAKGLGMATWEAGERAEGVDVSAFCDKPLPEWPHAEPPTADLLARYHLVHADLLRRDSNDQVDAGALNKDADPALIHAYLDKSAAFIAEWAVTFLLRAIQHHAPEVADQVAGELWNAIESGDTLHECTYEWLVDYRIDPAKVAAKHAEYVARRAAQKQPEAVADA